MENLNDYIVLFVLYVVIGNPTIYSAVDKIFESLSFENLIINENETTLVGLILHASVFVLVYFLYKQFVSKEENVPHESFEEYYENNGNEIEELTQEEEEEEEIAEGERDNEEHDRLEEQDQGVSNTVENEVQVMEQQTNQPQEQMTNDIGGFEGFSGGMGASI